MTASFAGDYLAAVVLLGCAALVLAAFLRVLGGVLAVWVAVLYHFFRKNQ